MVTEKVERVKFNELGKNEQKNCIDQFVYVVCAYEWNDIDPFEDIGVAIDLFVDATPEQFWFDENGDWYDEGRKVR